MKNLLAVKYSSYARNREISTWRTFAIKTRETYHTYRTCILNTSLWGVRDEKWTAHDGPMTLPDFFTSLAATALARGFLTGDD